MTPRCRTCQKPRSPQEAAAYRDRCEDCWVGLQPLARSRVRADKAKPGRTPEPLTTGSSR